MDGLLLQDQCFGLSYRVLEDVRLGGQRVNDIVCSFGGE